MGGAVADAGSQAWRGVAVVSGVGMKRRAVLAGAAGALAAPALVRLTGERLRLRGGGHSEQDAFREEVRG